MLNEIPNTPVLAMPVSERRDHLIGRVDAPVLLTEYGDFECPFCGQAHPILQELLVQDGDRVRLAFRHFPLGQVHPHAQQAAEAAEAAAAQGRFWEMHDTLFTNQDALELEDLVGYAHDLGLDVGRFQLELLQGVYAFRVREDFLGGVRSGVNGTPKFFINGYRFDGPWDLDSLIAAIDVAIVRQAAQQPQTHVRGHRRHE